MKKVFVSFSAKAETTCSIQYPLDTNMRHVTCLYTSVCISYQPLGKQWKPPPTPILSEACEWESNGLNPPAAGYANVSDMLSWSSSDREQLHGRR